jgi:P22_AR N-terminal domain
VKEEAEVIGGEQIPLLVPRMEKVVDFYGDNVPVAQTDDDKLYVPLRPLTRFLGISFGSQRDRILRDEVLRGKLRQVQMMGADNRSRQQLCLPLEMVPGWLFGISASRVRADLKERLSLYRAECFDVLWGAFKGEIMPYAPAIEQSGLTAAQQTLEMITAMQHLAQQQVEMERRVTNVEGRQEVIASYMRDFIHDTRKRLQDSEQRLSGLELRLDAGATISEEQAAEIALAVKNVGNALEQRGASGGYAKVYSEMYRRYRVSSYKNLSRAKYDEVLAWLSSWYDEVSGRKAMT